MPSGDAIIVGLRRELENIIDVPDTYPTLPASWVTSVFDAEVLQRPWPLHYVYVGHGPNGCGLNPSPWGSPFASSVASHGCPCDGRFLQYARGRADTMQWLRPLVEKCLVCHCGKNNCHAADIALLIHELFGSPDGPETAPYSQPTPGIYEAGDGVVPFDAGLVGLTSVGINLVGSISPSSAPPWPDEWTIMVESIRGSPNGLFWEVFAGSQSVTQSLSHRGWICAPPIDVADSIAFNVLNPVFLSILVGGYSGGPHHTFVPGPAHRRTTRTQSSSF